MTVINNGIVAISNGSALGQATGVGDGTNVVPGVANGSALQLVGGGGGFAVGNEALLLNGNGTGVGTNGALVNVSAS